MITNITRLILNQVAFDSAIGNLAQDNNWLLTLEIEEPKKDSHKLFTPLFSMSITHCSVSFYECTKKCIAKFPMN